MTITIDEMATFCKKKGLIFPNSELYGGVAGVFDYGPLGVELKSNIKAAWWRYHVQQRDDVVGIDGAILASPRVWKASGHVDSFTDVLVECEKCHSRHRADTLVEDATRKPADGMKPADLDAAITDHAIVCPKCKGLLGKARPFNLMFTTHIGPTVDENVAYLRPETAQLIFADFKAINDIGRVKLPFGIAQMGKAFRNEISPRNFLFRCREFEQMELEYFVHPTEQSCPYLQEVKDYRLLILDTDAQAKETGAIVRSMGEALEKGIIKTEWHAYWLAMEHQWFVSLGVRPENLRIRQHLADEKSHYALDTWDLEYNFPFGWKELQGMANRTDFDLSQHAKESGKDLAIFDEATQQKVVPHVIAEPSQGVERAFLVFLYEAYRDDKERGNVVLALHPRLAPIKAAIFPLLKNKPELVALAEQVHHELRAIMPTQLDSSGSIGRRYARADETGVPFCVTIDFDSIESKDVTVRDRDSTEQVRVPIAKLRQWLLDNILV